MEHVLEFLEEILCSGSKLMIIILELIGACIIIYGAFKALSRLVRLKFDFSDSVFRIMLAESFSSALQFKLGAEILKTVVLAEMSELIVVGFVTILRLIIAYAIHWEKQETLKHK